VLRKLKKITRKCNRQTFCISAFFSKIM